jgi:hypothetical protein
MEGSQNPRRLRAGGRPLGGTGEPGPRGPDYRLAHRVRDLTHDNRVLLSAPPVEGRG